MSLHPGHDLVPAEIWSAWSLEPWVLAWLALVSILYFRGTRRLWGRGGRGRGVRTWQAGCFAAGILMLAVALISPLDALGAVLFSAHMTQHTVLMLAAAPLLIAGGPLLPMLWALPRSWREGLGMFARVSAIRRSWRFITRPLVAWMIHAVALWTWHAPSLYQATLTSDLVHAAQHASFLGTALLFWWVVLPRGRVDRGVPGRGVLLVFTTAMHSGILGALITFARKPWYPGYSATAPWGLTPLEDQQLAGLIMWIPPGVVYLLAALLLFALWLGGMNRQSGVRGPDTTRTSRAAGKIGADVSAAGRRARAGASSSATFPVLILVLAACAADRERIMVVEGGDARRGPGLMRDYGCGTCHRVKGVAGATGRVGPPLDGFGSRMYIAGTVPNRPEDLVRWIMNPRAVNQHTLMPVVGVTEGDARHIAAWLYTRR